MTDSGIYHPLAATLSRDTPTLHPSELHGVVCGLLAAGQEASAPELLGMLASHAGLGQGWSEATAALIVAARDEAHAAFHGDALDLALALPDDEAPLDERVTALGLWCEGFMVGFGTGTAGAADADLPPAVQEAIADLSAVSRVEAPEDADEDAERMLEDVAEHCRVAALTIFTELALMRRREIGDNAPRTPTRH